MYNDGDRIRVVNYDEVGEDEEKINGELGTVVKNDFAGEVLAGYIAVHLDNVPDPLTDLIGFDSPFGYWLMLESELEHADEQEVVVGTD